MKISELELRGSAIEKKIIKISTEQQKRFDALSTEIDALKKALEEAEVPAPATESLDRVDTLLQQLDDTIIDTEIEPEGSSGARSRT